ncbi:hypothetical protein D3C77_293640 [compost metagenome]
MIKEAAEFAVASSLSEMEHNLRLMIGRCRVTYALNSLLQQLGQIVEISDRSVREQHPAINLVAYLHHIRISVYGIQLRQHFGGIVIDRLL